MIKKYLKKITATFTEVTHLETSGVFFFNQYLTRILVTSLRGFKQDNCSWKSAALTFYTILSIIPAFAVIFGVAKGFGFDKVLEKGVKSTITEYPLIADKLIELSNNYIEQTKGNLIAGAGVLFLFLTSITLLKRVEDALNQIWKVRKSRTFVRMVTDYLTMMILCPLFIITSAGISIYLATSFREVTEDLLGTHVTAPLSVMGFHLLPYFISWLLFTLLFLFIPNTRVNFRYALTAGIVSGTLYQVIQWFYIYFQINISNLGAVYGSFVALPLFFIWLNLSWTITLFGAELAYHATLDKEEQHVRKQNKEGNVEINLKELAVFATYRCIRRFKEHSPPLSPSEFANEVGVSLYTVSNVFSRLKEAGILVEITTERTEKSYHPGYATRDISIINVINAIDEDLQHQLTVNLSEDLQNVAAAIQDLNKDISQSSHNRILGDIYCDMNKSGN